MKIRFNIFLFALILFVFFPKKIFPQKIYLPFKQNQLWGVMDTEKNILLNPKYQHITFFEGTFAIATNQKQEKGIIDFEGNIIVEFKAYHTLDFLTDTDYIKYSFDGEVFGLLHFIQNKEDKTKYQIVEELPAKYPQINVLRRNLDVSDYNTEIIYTNKLGRIGILSLKNNGEIYTNVEFINPTFVRENRGNSALIHDFLITKKDNENFYTKTTGVYDINNKYINTINIPITSNMDFSEKNSYFIAQTPKQRYNAGIRQEEEALGHTIYDFRKKNVPTDRLYDEIIEKKGIFYMYMSENQNKKLSGIFTNGNITNLPDDLDITNLSYDTQARIYIGRDKTKVETIILNENFKIISISKNGFDEIGDFRGNLALIIKNYMGDNGKNVRKFGIINRRGVVVAPPVYRSVQFQGTKVRLYKQEKGGLCTNMIFDNLGNKIDEFEATIKLINLKGTSVEQEWEFTKRMQENNDILAQKEETRQRQAQNIALNNNPIVLPPNMVLEAPERDFQVGILSFRYDTLRKTLKNANMYHTKLTKPNEKRSCNVLISRDSNYVYLETHIEVIAKGEREIRRKGELINTQTGERLIEQTFNAYKRELEYAFLAFEKDEMALLGEKYFLDKTGKTIKKTDFIDKKTKKTEVAPFYLIRPTNLPNIKNYIVKATTDKEGNLMENTGFQGFVGNQGNIIVQPLYNQMYNFDENFLAKVEVFDSKKIDYGEVKFEKHNIKVGFIDSTGKEIVPTKYARVDYLFNKNTIKEKNRLVSNTQSSTNIIIPNQNPRMNNQIQKRDEIMGEKFLRVMQSCNRYALSDSIGNLKTPFAYNRIEAPYENLCVVEKNKLLGIINLQGKEVFSPKYQKLRNNGKNTFAVSEKNLWGLYNKNGQEIIPVKYQNIGEFQSEHTFIIEKNKYGIIDLQGNITTNPSFDRIENPVGNFAFALEKGNWGVIDIKGNWIIKPQFNQAGKIETKENIFIMQKTGLEYMIYDVSGKKISKTYRNIKPFKNGVAIAQKGINEYTLINAQGKELLKNEATEIHNFHEGLAVFKKDKLMGFLDTLGNEKIKNIFDFANDFTKGYAKVTKKGKIYFLDTKGDSLLKLPESIEIAEKENIEKHKTEKKRLAEMHKLLQKRLFFGENIVYFTHFPQHSAHCAVQLSYFMGVTSTEGTEITPVEAENIEMVAPDLFGISQNGKFGYWHKQNGWLLPLQE